MQHRPFRWKIDFRILLPLCMLLILFDATTFTNGFVGVQVATLQDRAKSRSRSRHINGRIPRIESSAAHPKATCTFDASGAALVSSFPLYQTSNDDDKFGDDQKRVANESASPSAATKYTRRVNRKENALPKSSSAPSPSSLPLRGRDDSKKGTNKEGKAYLPRNQQERSYSNQPSPRRNDNDSDRRDSSSDDVRDNFNSDGSSRSSNGRNSFQNNKSRASSSSSNGSNNSGRNSFKSHNNWSSGSSSSISNRNDNSRNSVKSNNNRPTGSSYKNARDAQYVLNQALAKAASASAVLQLLQQHATLQHVAAGQSLDSVGFSTSLHRLARYATAFGAQRTGPNDAKQIRAQTLSDPRTALLLTCLAEALFAQPQTFKGRELANIAWALSKLKLPPPLSVLPMGDARSIVASGDQLQHAAETVRKIVMDVARERARQQMDGSVSSSVTSTFANQWLPYLSQLSGYLLDYIGGLVWKGAALEKTPSTQPVKQPRLWFQMQEWSNLLWAWSTADRANHAVFGVIVRNMIQQQTEQLSRDVGIGDLSAGNERTSALTPQQWSNAIWAMATARCYNGHEELLTFVARLMEDYPDFIRDFKSQHLANTVWGVATLLFNKYQQQSRANEATRLSDEEQQSALTIIRYCLREVVQRNAAGLNTQELSNTAWAAAKVGFGLSTPTLSTMTSASQEKSPNGFIVLSSLQPSADTTLMVQAINVAISASMQQLPRFSSQQLANLAWALARLLSYDSNPNAIVKIARENAEPLLKGIGLQLANPQREIASQNVGNALWALATLNFCDESIYRAIARIIPRESHLYEPQHLSNTVWAFATAEVQLGDVDVFDTSLVAGLQYPTWPNDPITDCFAVAAQELMRRSQHFNDQDITNILWAFSKVGIRHPSLFKFIAEHMVGGANGTKLRGLEEFSSQELSNVAWAYAKQDQLAEIALERLKLNSKRGKSLAYRTIYVDVGEQRLHRLFGSIAKASLSVHDDLRTADPQAISNIAWAFATLGLKETRYLKAAKDALAGRIDRYQSGERNVMTRFGGQELSNLLWAFATLNVSPGKSLESLAPYLQAYCADSNGKVTAQSISKQFKREGLANLAWSCVAFGKYPNDLMHFLYTGLLGTPAECDPARVLAMYEDSGLQLSAARILIYAQADMQLRGCSQNLSLPENFPDAWLPSSIDRDYKVLDVSTSKMQRDVASAFTRIGFDHVEEYTITMADMTQMYGMCMPSSPMEILSIDVANVDEKIAIEVDGPPHYVCRIGNDIGEVESETFGNGKRMDGKLVYRFRWTGEQQEVNGATALKERLLTMLGWRVIHISFWEWDALGKDVHAKDEYCANLLRNLNHHESKDGPQ